MPKELLEAKKLELMQEKVGSLTPRASTLPATRSNGQSRLKRIELLRMPESAAKTPTVVTEKLQS